MFHSVRKMMFSVALIAPAMALFTSVVGAKPANGRANAVVPFSFKVGDQTLPADAYRVSEVSQGSPSYYVTNLQNGRSVMVLRRGRQSDSKSLQFAAQDGTYVLKGLR